MASSLEVTTFLDAVLGGRAFLEDVDGWVDRWHKADGAPAGRPVALHDYLGLGPIEYALWVELPSSLRFVTEARRAGRRVDDIAGLASIAVEEANDDAEAQRLVEWLRATRRIPTDHTG